MSVDEGNTSLWNGVKTNKHLCLDLDLTLVNTFTEIANMAKLNVYTGKNRHLRKRIYTIDLHDVVDTPGEGVYSRMWGVYRPGWFRFHNFAREYFESIIIWSAGQPKYVDAIVDVLFPDPLFQPVLIYNWNDCYSLDNNIYKPLKKLYNDSRLEGRVKPENTFVIDDRDDTFSQNVRNGILIPPYDIKSTEKSIMEIDIALLELENWFSQEHVSSSIDIRTLNKNGIFTSTKKKKVKKK